MNASRILFSKEVASTKPPKLDPKLRWQIPLAVACVTLSFGVGIAAAQQHRERSEQASFLEWSQTN